MQVRCPRCQTVLPADPAQPRLTCGSCGFQDNNPYYRPSPTPPAPAYAPPPAAAAPPAYGYSMPPPPAGTPPGAPYAYTIGMQGMTNSEAKSAETTALVFGLIAVIGGFIIGLPLLLGPVAIVYGNKANRLGGNGTAGLVMGWIATALLILAVLIMLFFFVLFASLASSI